MDALWSKMSHSIMPFAFHNKSSVELMLHAPWRHCCCSSSMASWLVYEVVQYTSSDFMTRRYRACAVEPPHGIDRCGWWKCTICSACGPVSLIWSKVKPVFDAFDSLIVLLLRCLHLEIWRFSCQERRRRWQRQMDKPITLPLVGNDKQT